MAAQGKLTVVLNQQISWNYVSDEIFMAHCKIWWHHFVAHLFLNNYKLPLDLLLPTHLFNGWALLNSLNLFIYPIGLHPSPHDIRAFRRIVLYSRSYVECWIWFCYLGKWLQYVFLQVNLHVLIYTNDVYFKLYCNYIEILLLRWGILYSVDLKLDLHFRQKYMIVYYKSVLLAYIYYVVKFF